jgi:signal transduction histidine kinase
MKDAMKPLTSAHTDEAAAEGRRLQVVEQERDEVRDRVEAMVRAERQRWAYEIHDGLTQAVAAAILQVDMLSRRVQTEPAAAAEDLEEASRQIRSAMADIRSMLFNLSDSPTDDPPSAQIETCIEEVAGRWHLDVSLTIEGDLLHIQPATLSVAKAVIHEGLTNAAKHAGGRVQVLVDVLGPQLLVSIRDQGPGLGDTDRRFGMRMMERRVKEAGGDLVVTSDGSGTRVVARLPLGVEL